MRQKNTFQILGITIIIFCISFCTQQKASREEKTTPDAAENKEQNVPLTRIEFKETDFDFGKIIKGEKVKHSFICKNIGQNNLIIKSATPSCGCTVSDWTKEPVTPGDSGEITVVFNSTNYKGLQKKSVRVKTNTDPDQTKLSFKAEVVEKK